MTGPPPIQQDGGAVTIRTPEMLAAAYRCTLAGIQRRRRDGLPAADLQQLARALYRAHQAAVARPRQVLATAAPGPPHSPRQNGNLIGVAEAAQLLVMSKRSVQRLAATDDGSLLGAVRCGSIWTLNRGAVLALAQRKAAR